MRPSARETKQWRQIEIEPEGSRWVHVHDADRSKRFERKGDAEAWAVARARSVGGAEVVTKSATGEVEQRRVVTP
jgi:hypothetical protein